MMQGCRAVHRFGRERRFPGLIKPAPPHRPTSGCVVIQDLSNPDGLNLTASLACRSPPVTKLGPNLMKSFRPASAGGWARCTDPMTTRLEPVLNHRMSAFSNTSVARVTPGTWRWSTWRARLLGPYPEGRAPARSDLETRHIHYQRT